MLDAQERSGGAVDGGVDAGGEAPRQWIRRVVGIVRVDGVQIEEGSLAGCQTVQPGEGAPVNALGVVVEGAGAVRVLGEHHLARQVLEAA